MKATLQERILAKIAKATSQKPARAADVLAQVGGEEPAFCAAIDVLYAERRINTAHITEKGDPEPWLAIWPTGVCLPAVPMTGNSLSGLFVKPRPGDLHAAYAPRSTAKPVPAPMSAPATKPVSTKERSMRAPTDKRHAHGTRPDGVVAAAAHVLTVMADAISPDNPRPSAHPAPHPLYRAGDIEVTEIPATAVGEAADAAPDADVRFALWDDGTLTISDGDDILQYDRATVRRLAMLLGVPGAQSVSD